MTFRRITELSDGSTVPVRSNAHQPDRTSIHETFAAPWTRGSLAPYGPKLNSGDDDADLIQLLSRFRRVRIISPEAQGFLCGVWALWDHERGEKTLQGVGKARVRTIKVWKSYSMAIGTS